MLTIASESVQVAGDLTVTGNLTVSGTSTTITSSTLEVNDKNIVIGNVSAPNRTTADGGGITLKANGDKTIIYTNTGDRWNSNIDWNLDSGKVYRINGSSVLSSDSLGTTVVDSSLTSVGTLSSLNVSGSVGIGTTSPGNALQVVSTIEEMVEFKNTSTYSRLVLNGAASHG